MEKVVDHCMQELKDFRSKAFLFMDRVHNREQD